MYFNLSMFQYHMCQFEGLFLHNIDTRKPVFVKICFALPTFILRSITAKSVSFNGRLPYNGGDVLAIKMESAPFLRTF